MVIVYYKVEQTDEQTNERTNNFNKSEKMKKQNIVSKERTVRLKMFGASSGFNVVKVDACIKLYAFVHSGYHPDVFKFECCRCRFFSMAISQGSKVNSNN